MSATPAWERTGDERLARIALAAVAPPGSTAVGAAVRQHGAIATARRSAAAVDVAAVLAATDAAQARILVPGDPGWPTQLDDLGDEAPLALWVRGDADLRLAVVRSVGVVGARASTPYGERVCRQWSSALVDADFAIVSGGAFGIDAAAHRAALDAQGVTICLLACGIDIAYPRAHAGLLARIAEQGAIVTERPPGAPVRRQGFLARNRLIPGLTRATLIVEAAARSGTIATANHAVRIGRPVLAVPGPVTSPMSWGCHDLLADGSAVVARDARDVIAAAEGRWQARPVPRRAIDGLDARQLAVFEELPRRRGLPADRIAARAGLGVADVLAVLGGLEHGGWAERDASGCWRVSADASAPGLPR